jgi:hypothetical protein
MSNATRNEALSTTQKTLLTQAESLAGDHGILVSGHKYRTALSLERKGMGTVRYQGPSLGWFATIARTS